MVSYDPKENNAMCGTSLSSRLVLIAATGILASCTSLRENATFVTKTSLSIVDVDAAPASVSIAYDRLEGYAGPRFEDGSVYPVVGSMEISGSGLTRTIRQVYAGGDAARVVTGLPASTAASAAADGNTDQRRVLFFGTGTTIGLKVGFTENLPSSFTLGYKRREASVVPVDRDRQPSVLASLDNGDGVAVSADGAKGKPAVAFGVQQYFATGAAATKLAALPAISKGFQERGAATLGDIAQFRVEEAAQTRSALDAVSCLYKVLDGKLDRVWNNADDLKVFGDTTSTTIQRIKGAGTPAAQREVYSTRLAALLDPKSDQMTQALRFHAQTVCALAI
jgi:hypothetical protein